MLKNTGRLPTSAACRCRRRASSRRRPTRAAPRAAAARTCSPLSSAMPSAVESTTTTAGLHARGMRRSTEPGDDDDDEQVARQRQPQAPKHVPLVGEQHHAVRRDVGRRAHRLLGHLEYGSGRSSRPRRQYLCGRRELRVGLERGVGTWLGEGRCWRHTVRCAHVNEKHVPRERRQLRVGMGAVYWNEGAGSRE